MAGAAQLRQLGKRQLLREQRFLQKLLLDRVLLHDGDESLRDFQANILRAKLVVVNSVLHELSMAVVSSIIASILLDKNYAEAFLVYTSDNRNGNSASQKSRREDQISDSSETEIRLHRISPEVIRQHSQAN